jgi:hypothetical protein
MLFLVKIISLLFFTLFGMTFAALRWFGVGGDATGRELLGVLFEFFQYVFKASVAIPYAYMKWVSPRLGEVGPPFLVIIVFLWAWFMFFHPLLFMVGSFLLGYAMMLIDTIMERRGRHQSPLPPSTSTTTSFARKWADRIGRKGSEVGVELGKASQIWATALGRDRSEVITEAERGTRLDNIRHGAVLGDIPEDIGFPSTSQRVPGGATLSSLSDA